MSLLGWNIPAMEGRRLAGARQAWRGEAVDLVALESPVAGLGKLVVRGLDTGAEGAEVFIGVDEGAEEGKGIVSALNVSIRECFMFPLFTPQRRAP